MRSRNREISIFSLSLMDVISGAMGAFLIVMVILSQYYVIDPRISDDAADLREKLDAAIEGLGRIRGGTERIFSDLIESERGASTRGFGEAQSISAIEELGRGIAADIERVNNQLSAAHAQTERLTGELQEKSAQLARAENLIGRLESRQALAVAAQWTCAANVDLFIESDRVSEGENKRGAAFDPRARLTQNFTGDASSDTSAGPGAELSLVGETPKNTSYKVFVNLLKPPADADCEVTVHAIGYNGFFALAPKARLSMAQPYDYLGVFTVDENYALAFAAPSESEKRNELAAVERRVRETRAPA